MPLSRRTLLRTAAAAPLAVPAAGSLLAGNSYAGLRIVKPLPTAATTPLITLPDGYSLVTGTATRFASPWQFYAYVQGPASASARYQRPDSST